MPHYDRQGRPVDLLGRPQPHRMNAITFAQVAHGYMEQFDKRVPDEFVSLDRGEEGETLAVVACPCGGTPEVPLLAVRGCECDRIFLYTGQVVRVARSATMPA